MAVYEQTGDLGFGRGVDDGGYDRADDVDGAVARDDEGIAVGGEEVNATGTGSCVTLG